ncbi:MAG: transketolase [Lachnospiraceae bacterium]|jgi:transketolase|nr:transketolase [Lachnospiraceae bacterium]
MDDKRVKELEIFAAQIRLETFKELTTLGFGHVGGAMSIVDALAVLYGEAMNIDPQKKDWEERDYFSLSKGHAGPALYATLALKGYFPMEMLKTLNQNKTKLPSHCSRVHTPGVDLTTGSLGQGISTGIGAALASRVLGGKNYAYCIVGDGECDEGQIWEGVLFAAHQKLDNFVLFVDSNKKQLDGTIEEVCSLGNLEAKFEAFDWHVQSVYGHSVKAIAEAVENAKAQEGEPSVIILNTVKGKGCRPAEEAAMNHHMMFPNAEENQKEQARMEQVLEDLQAEWRAM